MQRNVISIGVFLFCLAVLGCREQPSQEKPELDPEAAAGARRTIVAWLECEECTEGELKAVVNLGGVAVPTLAAVLADGPSQSKRELYRRHLSVTYRALKDYEKGHPESRVSMSEEEYVKTYMENYTALYKIRAAEALGAIRSSDAKEALEKAVDSPMREDVKAAIVDSIKIGTWPTPEKNME